MQTAARSIAALWFCSPLERRRSHKLPLHLIPKLSYMDRQSTHRHEKRLVRSLYGVRSTASERIRSRSCRAKTALVWSGRSFCWFLRAVFKPCQARFGKHAWQRATVRARRHGHACRALRQWLFCAYLISWMICAPITPSRRLSLTSILCNFCFLAAQLGSARLLLACMQRRRQSENLWRLGSGGGKAGTFKFQTGERIDGLTWYTRRLD
jgi:hypothetical protein